MSCIFCDENNHFSQNCNNYISNEDREKILETKNRCKTCTTKENTFLCCYRNKKCYTCFSKAHHTVYCPDRFTAPNMFIPKIDSDLISRFMQILAFEEKYSMAFLFPELLNFVKMKRLIVNSKRSINFYEIHGSDIIVADKGNINNAFMKKNYEFIIGNCLHSLVNKLHERYFWIKSLEISRSTFASSDIFLKLLSTKTTKLECRETNFEEKLCFRDILINAPYLDEIILHLTNIEFGNLWPDEILWFSHSKMMKQICFSITDLNFKAESLARLMKEKSVAVSLFVNLSHEKLYDKQEITNFVISKFLNYFIRCDIEPPLRISLSYLSNSAGKIEIEVFNMKNL